MFQKQAIKVTEENSPIKIGEIVIVILQNHYVTHCKTERQRVEGKEERNQACPLASASDFLQRFKTEAGCTGHSQTHTCHLLAHSNYYAILYRNYSDSNCIHSTYIEWNDIQSNFLQDYGRSKINFNVVPVTKTDFNSF